MNEQMEFPETWEEYEQEYGFNDSDEVYTNNSRLIQSFRVKQWLDHLEQEPKTDVLDKIIAEIYEEFMTVDGGVHDKSAKKCMQIIDKYKAESEDKE